MKLASPIQYQKSNTTLIFLHEFAFWFFETIYYTVQPWGKGQEGDIATVWLDRTMNLPAIW